VLEESVRIEFKRGGGAKTVIREHSLIQRVELYIMVSMILDTLKVYTSTGIPLS